jgi:hypothetical protein
MASTAAPFGLRPAYSPSGTIRPVAMTILTGYSSNIFQFSPVAIAGDGTITLAAAASPAVGAFMGVEWTDTDGRRRVSNKWTASTSATDIVCYVTTDPYIVYEIQGDGTGTAVQVTNIGNQYDWTANGTSNGNTTTGLSTVGLAVSTVSTSGNNGLRLLGLAPYPDNAWGDAYATLQVQISEHQFVATIAAF